MIHFSGTASTITTIIATATVIVVQRSQSSPVIATIVGHIVDAIGRYQPVGTGSNRARKILELGSAGTCTGSRS